jgi:hypothetical protein
MSDISSAREPASLSFAALLRLLYTQNPFYLIGTFLVIFGLQQSLGSRQSLATSGLLVALLAGYALMLAAVALVVIRWGKVWDDARTILLVIVLMFFMLSSSLDVHILYDPVPGTLMLGGGLMFSVALSEGLLRALAMRLAAVYRGPYYLMLTLLFGYPVALAWISRWDHYEVLTWALFTFPALAGLALLALLPAAQLTRRREPASGTPWRWPYYPWSLFVYLTIGVAIRAWWLTIAFEPTEGQDSCFRLYFLAPLVLAWSALVTEIGKSRHRPAVTAIGMLMPLSALLVAFPGNPANPVEHAFIAKLALAIGSPAQLVVGGMIAFYAIAWLRRMRGAEAYLVAVTLLASLIGRDTLGVQTLTMPQPWIVVAIVIGLFVQAIRRESTWRAVVAGAIAMGAVKFSEPASMSDIRWFWQTHLPLLAALWLAALFNDDFAKFWRELAWRAAPVLAGIAAIVYPWTMPAVSPAVLTSYSALLLMTSILLWWRDRQTASLAALAVTLIANLAAHVPPVYRTLEQTLLADGLPWLALGLAVVGFGFAISLWKMGLRERAWRWLEQVNLALGGQAVVET